MTTGRLPPRLSWSSSNACFLTHPPSRSQRTGRTGCTTASISCASWRRSADARVAELPLCAERARGQRCRAPEIPQPALDRLRDAEASVACGGVEPAGGDARPLVTDVDHD